jgi:hypothetical protein
VTIHLGRALLLSGAVTTDALGEALLAMVTQGIPLARALLNVGALTERRLEQELARVEGPTSDPVIPQTELMDLLPPGICHRLYAVPIRLEAGTEAVDLAVLDTRDTHPAHEIGHHLRRPVRMVRAPYRALRDALDLCPVGVRALAAPMTMPQDEQPKSTLAWGTRIPNTDDIDEEEVATRPVIIPKRASSDVPIPLTRKHVQDVRVFQKNDAARGLDAETPSELEPIFELRRLGPPPTIPDPEPPTVQVPPAFPLFTSLPSRSPVAPNAPSPPFADVGAVLAAIRAAEDRDAVLGLVVLGVRSVARRIALFVVKKDAIVGWSCTPEFGDEGWLRALRISTTTPNMLTTALSGGVYLGPLLGSVSGPLLRIMRTASHDVALAPIKVSDRPSVLILADELGDTLLATKRMEEIARAAGETLTRIVRTRK